jgi:hypothetical protein
VWACAVSFRDRLRVPIVDDWRVLDDFYAMSFLEWVFSEQNGHRTSFTFLAFALDYRFFDGRQDVIVLASFATAGLAVGILYAACRSHRTERSEGGFASASVVVAFGFACFATFWAGAGYNFLWGLCQGNLMVALWLYSALACLVAYVHPRDGSSGAGRSGLLVVAAIAAVAAAFSLAEGLAVWPALIGVAIVARLPARLVALHVLGFALTLGLYSIGLGNTGKFSPAASLAVLLRPLDVLYFGTSYLGSAPGRTLQALGLFGSDGLGIASCFFGAAGLVGLVAYSVWQFRGAGKPGRRDLVALGIMAFVVATAALVAAGRLPRAPVHDAVSERFLNWSAMFWAGGVLALPTFARGRWGAALVAAIPIVSLCMLPAIEPSRVSLLRWNANGKVASLGLLLGIQEPSLPQKMGAYVGLPLVSDDPSQVERASIQGRTERFERVTARLRRDRRSFFADPHATLPGATLGERFALVPSARCRGAMSAPILLADTLPPAAEVGGSARGETDEDSPPFVVITDASGTIRGLGRNLAVPGGPLASRFRWSGYVAGFDPSQRYNAYAVVDDGASACPLRRVR